jgi:hypothetical protein
MLEIYIRNIYIYMYRGRERERGREGEGERERGERGGRERERNLGEHRSIFECPCFRFSELTDIYEDCYGL